MDVGEELAGCRAGLHGFECESAGREGSQEVDQDGVVAVPGIKDGFEHTATILHLCMNGHFGIGLS